MMGAFVPVSDTRPTTGFVVQENGCWEWVGYTIHGYGLMGKYPHSKKNTRAHRYYYELEYGPIPEGLDLDHLCRNRKCVRPDHLEPVTRRENVLRGVGPTAVHARKTHCPQGHAYTADNTHRYMGKRYCMTCSRYRSKNRSKPKGEG